MSLLKTTGRTIGQFYEEAEHSGTLSLAPITEALGGSYGLFFGAQSAGGGVDEAFCHGVDHGYVDRLRQASEEHLLPPWLDGLEPGSVFDRAAFGSDQAFGRTAFFNHVIRPEGRFHCMIATPYVTQSRRFHLVVGRPRHKAEFDAEDCRVLQAMLPHVSEVIRLRAELAEARTSTRWAQRFVDGLPMRMIVVAADATVTFANHQAQQTLALRNELSVDAKGRLTAATPRETTLLRQTVAAAAASGTVQAHAIELARPFGGDPARIMVSRIHAPQDGGVAGGPDVMVLIDPQDCLVGADPAVSVARSYGLTRRETDLALLLASGNNLQHASRELHMSYNTARAYLRQIFGKADVHRQSDLIRLLTTGLRPDPKSTRI